MQQTDSGYILYSLITGYTVMVDVFSTESETKNHSSLFIISAVNGEKII